MRQSQLKSHSNRRPPVERPTRGENALDYSRTDQEVIDEDLRVTIYKSAASSSWYVQYNCPSDGQRKRSLRTRNKKQARRRAWEIAVRLNSGDVDLTARRGLLLKDAINGFLSDKHRIGRRDSTIIEYRRNLEQFHQFVSDSGVVRLSQLTPTHMEEYEAQLRKAGITLRRKATTRGRPAKRNNANTVLEKIKLVKSLAKWAVSMRKLADNPISGYQLPSGGKPENYCFTAHEVQAICDSADPFFAHVFRFLAVTGLRQGELIWLTKADVDLEQRLLWIRTKVFPDEGLRWDPKGDDRAVPLSKPALAIATRMLASSDGRWMFAAPPAPGVLDARLRASRLWTQLKKAKNAAGIAQGTLHSFRHYFVSTMANANVSPFKVMKIVGHRNLDIVLTYYHVSVDELLSDINEVEFEKVFGFQQDQNLAFQIP